MNARIFPELGVDRLCHRLLATAALDPERTIEIAIAQWIEIEYAISLSAAFRELVLCTMEVVVNWSRKITGGVEPLADAFYGPRYRCSLTLNDGTFLPCVVLQSRKRLVELAKRRIQEEMSGRGRIGGDDPYGQIVSSFVAGGNRVAAYDVAEATQSRFAPPLELLSRIQGETTMGWTGWVFRMRDQSLFSYGSSFRMEFLQLPDGYEFSDVDEVINHSFVNPAGTLSRLEQGHRLPEEYLQTKLLRERAPFSCAVDGIE